MKALLQTFQTSSSRRRVGAGRRASRRSLTLTEGEEPLRLQGRSCPEPLPDGWAFSSLWARLPRRRRRSGRTGRDPAQLRSVGRRALRRRQLDPRRSHLCERDAPPLVGVMPKGFKSRNSRKRGADHADSRWTSARMARGHIVGRLKSPLTWTSQHPARRRVEATGGTVPASVRGLAQLRLPLREAFHRFGDKARHRDHDGRRAFVLLIACANVANLSCPRHDARTRNRRPCRARCGARPHRASLLTESVLLGVIALPIGLASAYWLLDIIIASIPEGDLPY